MDNRTTNSVIDMELTSPTSGDRDERIRVQASSTPIVEPIHQQFLTSLSMNQTISTVTDKTPDKSNSNSNELIRPLQFELPLWKLNFPTNNIDMERNVEQIVVLSKENNNIDDHRTSIIKNNSKEVINIEEDPSHSRDELVMLLAKETYPSKSPDHGKSYADGNLSSKRTVTFVSSAEKNSLMIETKILEQQNDDEDEKEPAVKRIKVASLSSSNDGLPFYPFVLFSFHLFFLDGNSCDISVDDYDYRRNFDERNRQARIDDKLYYSHSSSKSTCSSNSSVKEMKTRSSSVNNHNPWQRSNESKDEHNDSCNRSYSNHQQNLNKPISIHSSLVQHDHQSVVDHSRFVRLLTPVEHFDCRSFTSSNHSPSMIDDHKRSTMTSIDRK